MGRNWRSAWCVLLILWLISCTARPETPAQTLLYVYRLDPPAFLEFSADFEVTREIPFSMPPDCGLLDSYSAPVGRFLLVELSCASGQTVLLLDSDSGSMSQPVPTTDSHFLAWAWDGKSAYLKVDSLASARVVRIYTNGKHSETNVSGWTYDLSVKPNADDFIFTFSRGLGSGSEMNLSQNHERSVEGLYADRLHYISFARYSPDGAQIAFIKIPDSQTPFTVGELWVMNADGSNPRKLADTDAGHGYAANWSPDGSQIAFVRRENRDDESANQSIESLISNVYVVEVTSGESAAVTTFREGRAETPRWSPDGNTVAFNVVLNGRIEVQIADVKSGQIRSLITQAACCPAWIQK